MYVDMNPLTLINMSATVSNIERISKNHPKQLMNNQYI
jgi:hypothetical protein